MRLKYAIITATQERFGAHDVGENVDANLNLEQELKDQKFDFERCTGYYKGVNQGVSFIIFGVPSLRALLDLASEYHQESIICDLGLAYTDGTIQKVLGEIKGQTEARASGNYTELADGSAFALVLDTERTSL